MHKLTLVIIPTFNEEESIGLLLNQLAQHPFDILIVDDGSSDLTLENARSSQIEQGKLNFLKRNKKLGLGSAYRAGYAWALEKGYERVIQMDADGSHQVSDLLTMIEYADSNPETELIIGSRWVKGGKVLNWNKGRELLSRFANRYTQALIKIDVKDSTAGFRIYKASLLSRMDIGGVRSDGYCYQIEMTREARDVEASVAEVPITFKEREFGKSKMSANIVAEAMARITYWGLIKNRYHLSLLLLGLFTSFTTLWELGRVQRSEYYAAIAMSMSKNFGNLFFGAIDPAGIVSLDKIPGSYWLPAIFVKLFGFSTWSIMAPNAIATVAFVVLVAIIGKRLFGTGAALLAGAIAATTPIVIAVARSNQPQSMFLLVLAIAAFWAIKALDSYRRRDLVITGAFIALAFQTYMLQAWALWPPLIIAWLFTNQSFRKKSLDLLVAGATSLILSLTWILIVWAVPSAHRPFVGGTINNNPFEMVFGYNGLGRFASTTSALSSSSANANFRSFTPPFGGEAGFGRIFSSAVLGQIAWLLPAAALSILVLYILGKRNTVLVFLSIWLATYFTMFSVVAGIHQFYTSSLSIPVAILVSGAMIESIKAGNIYFSFAILVCVAISALVISGVYPNYLPGVSYVQAAIAITALFLIALNLKNPTLLTGVLLVAMVLTPGAWAFDAQNYSNSVNPVAGKAGAMSAGGFMGQPDRIRTLNQPNNWRPRNFDPKSSFGKGMPPRNQNFGGSFGQQDVTSTAKYLQANRKGANFLLVTFGAQSAAPYITLTGDKVLPIGGFDGQDPTPTFAAFKKMVATGEIRFVLLGGDFGINRGANSGRETNSETRDWVSHNCLQDLKAPNSSLYVCSPSQA